jgi:drug/metabolite transporter (DMT)-like permease
MGPTFILWSVLSTMSVYFIGHIVYKEQITMQDILGGSLCFIGLYLVYNKN